MSERRGIDDMHDWDADGWLTRRTLLRAATGAGACLMTGVSPLHAAESMRRRAIPSSGESLPVVGIGTWQTFDVGGSASGRERLSEVLRVFVANGGSLIDSSPMYGSSEQVVGDLAAALEMRDDLFFATKVWTEGEEAGRSQMDESFEKLRTDRIDLMQVHNLVDWRTHLRTLRDWQQRGRVRYVGVSHYRESAYPTIERLLRDEPLDFLQINYSVAEPESGRRLLAAAAERDVAVIVNRPFGGGGLFGRVRGVPVPDWAAEIDCESWAQLFLKYVLAHPAVTCVIPGTGKPEHMRDNLRAGFGRLPDAATRHRLETLFASL